MPRHHQTLAIAAIVVVVAAASYLAIRHNNAIGKEISGTETQLPDQEYENATYGFSFTYPARTMLSELTSRSIGILEREGGEASAEVDIEFADAQEQVETVSDFAHARAATTCESKSSTISTRCSQVSRAEVFTSSFGIVGEVFYLEYVTTTKSAVTTREAGPFYAFDISHGGAEGPFGIVLIRPSHSAEESTTYDKGVALAYHIAQSFRFVSVADE